MKWRNTDRRCLYAQNGIQDGAGRSGEAGDKITVSEGVLPSSWYYTIEPAVAMSANYTNRERLSVSEGVVVEVRTDESGYTVVAEFEE